jgi:hypothetical protein
MDSIFTRREICAEKGVNSPVTIFMMVLLVITGGPLERIAKRDIPAISEISL